MYNCKYFKLHELVDKDTYNNTPHHKLWWALDDRILKAIDILREEIGVSITINNWHWGKDRQWSGLRVPSSPYYSQWSQHSFGRAVDMLFTGINATDARKKIKALIDSGKLDSVALSFTFEEKMKGKEISWVHMDLRNNKEGYNGFNI